MKPAFDIKSARTDALAVHLHTTDGSAIAAALDKCAAQYRELNLPLILDMQAFQAAAVDIPALLSVFRACRVPVAALRHGDERWAKIAALNGLAYSPPGKSPSAAAAGNTEPGPSETPPAPGRPADKGRPTVFVSTPVRTGQQVYAENTDLIVTGMVSEGAELIADGNIHVYAPMRGRAQAGAKGRRDARIFIHSMQAELVSVAGIYRNFEQQLPPHLHKQPVQVYLQDDRLIVAAIGD